MAPPSSRTTRSPCPGPPDRPHDHWEARISGLEADGTPRWHNTARERVRPGDRHSVSWTGLIPNRSYSISLSRTFRYTPEFAIDVKIESAPAGWSLANRRPRNLTAEARADRNGVTIDVAWDPGNEAHGRGYRASAIEFGRHQHEAVDPIHVGSERARFTQLKPATTYLITVTTDGIEPVRSTLLVETPADYDEQLADIPAPQDFNIVWDPEYGSA